MVGLLGERSVLKSGSECTLVCCRGHDPARGGPEACHGGVICGAWRVKTSRSALRRVRKEIFQTRIWIGSAGRRIMGLQVKVVVMVVNFRVVARSKHYGYPGTKGEGKRIKQRRVRSRARFPTFCMGCGEVWLAVLSQPDFWMESATCIQPVAVVRNLAGHPARMRVASRLLPKTPTRRGASWSAFTMTMTSMAATKSSSLWLSSCEWHSCI